MIEMRVEIPRDVNSSNLSYVLEFDGDEREVSEPVLEQKIESAGLVDVRAQVYNGSESIYSEGRSLEVTYSENVSIELSPESVEPGNKLEAVAKVGGEVREDFIYNWVESGR
ncbi:MAG: hypothetical protein ABEJ56_03260 [Candidatus Nanohaloarchaea archaeon]